MIEAFYDVTVCPVVKRAIDGIDRMPILCYLDLDNLNHLFVFVNTLPSFMVYHLILL